MRLIIYFRTTPKVNSSPAWAQALDYLRNNTENRDYTSLKFNKEAFSSIGSFSKIGSGLMLALSRTYGAVLRNPDG